MSKAKKVLVQLMENLWDEGKGDGDSLDLALSSLRGMVMGIETPFILTSYDRQAFELARKSIADELFGKE